MLLALPAWGDPVPRELQGIDVEERSGEVLPADLVFTDHTGQSVRFGDLFDGQRPVLLTLNYYGCPMLCGLQLNALNEGLRTLDWAPGENFRVVTVSFAPDETASLAAAKRANYIESLGRGDVDWVFLVGDEANIGVLTDLLGYRYHFVEETQEYAHPSVLIFLSPSRMVTRYLYGLVYPSRDIRLALLEAAEGRIGTTWDRIILGCYIYDPHTGGYVQNAWAVMRLGGFVTVILLSLLLVLLWRTDRRRGTVASAEVRSE
jgi:protein SCO1/2